MEEKYIRDNKLIKMLLTESLYLIIGVILVTPIYFYLQDGEWFDFDLMHLKIFILIIVIYYIPVILIYFDYYSENKDMKVSIDKNKIEIIKNGVKNIYKMSEIKSSIYNLGIYHKNKIDNVKRWKMINSDFAYWDLEFNNGDRYYISNMIIDFLHKKPIVENTRYRFRMFQFIDKSDSKETKELQQEQEMTRENRLRYLYNKKTNSELEYIVENEKLYMENARKVAKEMLVKRRKSES